MNYKADIFSRIRQRWSDYWFSETTPVGYGVFRIAFGLVLLLYHVPRLWYIPELYTRAGYVFPMPLFFVLHLPIPSFGFAALLNVILICAIIFFIFGYKTRISAIVIFALHTYFSLLERFSTKGYGSIMIIYALLLIFSPCGEFLSVDSMRKRSRSFMKNPRVIFTYSRVPITMQRIMLWQLAEIYFFNTLSKLSVGGWNWFNGKNVLNIYRDTEIFARPFVLPLLEAFKPLPVILGILIPGTLFFIAFGLLRRNDRPYAIAFGIFYHVFALVTTTVPYVFTFLMLSLYIIAIEPDVWERWWSRFIRHYEGKQAALFYDDTCALCRRSVALIHAADMLNRIRYVGISSVFSATAVLAGREVSRQELLREMHMVSADGSVSKGFFAFRAIARIVPLFWIIVPLLYVPGARWAGERIYSFIARRRKNICRNCA